jgi:hypothetical protein
MQTGCNEPDSPLPEKIDLRHSKGLGMRLSLNDIHFFILLTNLPSYKQQQCIQNEPYSVATAPTNHDNTSAKDATPAGPESSTDPSVRRSERL